MGFYGLWLKRVVFSSKTIFQFSALFSLFGLVLAVASLTVAILVVNGFSSGLEKAIVEKQGHLRIQAKDAVSRETLLNDISPYKKFIAHQALFSSFEGLILQGTNFKGVIFEAVEDEKLKSLSFLKERILEGRLDHPEPFVIVGSDLAQELQIEAGAKVLVTTSDSTKGHFSRRSPSPFKVSGIVDFGRHKLNSFLVVMPLSVAPSLGKERVSGVNVWLKNPAKVLLVQKRMRKGLRDSYIIQSWKDMDKYFFEVIESDKKIIFLVLLILMVVAGFNVSSSLFVQVFRKTKEISILKALGAKKELIRGLFLINGLIFGLVGSVFGLILGFFFCYILIVLQNTFRFVPAKVYKVNEMVLDWQTTDILFIFIASVSVVILSSLLPAYRAYKMDVKRGLSHT